MVELFINGGNFMWPILAIFIVGLVFVGERLMHLISSSKWGEEFAGEVTETLDSAGALESQTLCEKGQGPIANLLLVGLNNIKKGREVSIEEIVVAEEKVVFKLPKELN